MAGGRPILVDMNPETLALDVADLARKLTPATKGIIWVHLVGLISDEFQAIRDFADRHGLFDLTPAGRDRERQHVAMVGSHQLAHGRGAASAPSSPPDR
jgi:hypothetical protein